MTLYQARIGNAEPKWTILTGNTVTDLIEATDGTTTVVTVRATNLTNAAITFTLEAYDGTTSHYLAYQTSVPANDATEFPGVPLPLGSKLRGTSGDASGNLHVLVLYTLPQHKGVAGR